MGSERYLLQNGHWFGHLCMLRVIGKCAWLRGCCSRHSSCSKEKIIIYKKKNITLMYKRSPLLHFLTIVESYLCPKKKLRKATLHWLFTINMYDDLTLTNNTLFNGVLVFLRFFKEVSKEMEWIVWIFRSTTNHFCIWETKSFDMIAM